MVSKPRTWQARNRRIMGFVIPAVLIALPGTAGAQLGVSSADTVTAIANAFFAAVVAGRWSEASRLLDTTSLSAIRRQNADYAKHWRATRPVTLKQFMETNPDVPRAVATYKVKEANERTRELGKALSVYGVEDPDSLLALPIEAYASRWLEIHDERWQLRESARRCGHGTPSEIPIGAYRTIASVSRDSIAYVLYDPGAERSPWVNAREPRAPRVMVLRRAGSTWAIVPRDDLVGWGEMVNACG